MGTATGMTSTVGADTWAAKADPRDRSVEEDWTLVYQTYARPIYRFLLKLNLGNQREAEDHLQETFLRVWRWLQIHPLDLDGIRGWLHAVARRIVIDALRARAARPIEVIVDDLNHFAGANNAVEDVDRAQVVRQAMLSLTEEHRAALIEIYYRERTAKEAAAILGIPEGTVKSRAHYALRALRTALAAELDESTPRALSPARRNANSSGRAGHLPNSRRPDPTGKVPSQRSPGRSESACPEQIPI